MSKPRHIILEELSKILPPGYEVGRIGYTANHQLYAELIAPHDVIEDPIGLHPLERKIYETRKFALQKLARQASLHITKKLAADKSFDSATQFTLYPKYK